MYSQEYFTKFNSILDTVDAASFQNGMDLVKEAWLQKRNVITLGNGGSSITALHFITDWNKSIYLETKKPFYGRTLVDNIGLLMAYGNDISFEDIFAEQLKNILKPSDLVIAISGSGNSENVIRAVEYANQNEAVTLGLCGYSGGRLKQTARHSIWINSYDMQLVEDFHAMFGHMTMQYLMRAT